MHHPPSLLAVWNWTVRKLRYLAVVLIFSHCQAADPSATAASVSFIHDVVPVLTKAGCNAGICHAKAGNGQNGFQLSLLGFEPQEDYDHLVKESRGRRLSLAAPEQSLLLQKASGVVPHRGGVRLPVDSEGYNQLLHWIRQGAPYDGASAPKLQSLEVQPDRGVAARGSSVRLQVWGLFSDGSRRDVTRLALFESNDPAMAEAAPDGSVTIGQIPGKVAIMVRFEGQVAVHHAAVPLGEPVVTVPPIRNFIDQHLFRNLQELGIPPSPVCDDATFARRVALDLAGRLPSPAELDAYWATPQDQRRDWWIERLIASGEYADFFANKWTAMLKNRRDDASDITSNFAFYSWVRDSLLANKPYDTMVRELLAATGTVLSNPPVAWYKRVKDPKQQVEDVAQLFLGVRMQCAQCHHHPFERWSQEDYYRMSAFFTQVGRKPTSTRGEDSIFHKRGIATAVHVKTGAKLTPAPLGSPPLQLPPDEDPRLKLADWMRDPANPFFAKSLVNRYWKHFFRRGLIEPEDDIRDSNPPSNPELLLALESHFRDSGFDLKDLVRTIVRSHAYQLSSQPTGGNLVDQQNYSRYYPRRLQAEVLLDSVDDLTGSRTDFANLPAGTRAIALPDNSYNNASPFLRVFGRPENESVCECERIQTSSLAQSLHLINAGDVKAKLQNPLGRIEQLLKDQIPDDQAVRLLYRSAFARDPNEGELRTAIEYLQTVPNDVAGNPIDPARAKRENYQDLVWSLINTKEFLFNH
ncbi:MAG: DUF1549 and DUF1553 domain-containing protein [Pirellulaceae bacterium]